MLLFLMFVLAIILSLAVCVYVLLQQAAGDAAGRSMNGRSMKR
jgi:preprotein translocase subunit SecG